MEGLFNPNKKGLENLLLGKYRNGEYYHNMVFGSSGYDERLMVFAENLAAPFKWDLVAMCDRDLMG